MKKSLFFCFATLHMLIVVAQQPQGLNVNDKAPLFTAKNQQGIVISLEEELKKGPVVLFFYRGQWCPYCNKQLQQLQDSMQLILEKGASVIAVTAENNENITKTIQKTKATFTILHDNGLTIMRKYDVAFTVDDKTISAYKKYGIDFNEVNGDNGANLPVPAVYIINKENKIVYKYFDKNYTKRATIQEIVSKL
jgi:peroxiredoxin